MIATTNMAIRNVVIVKNVNENMPNGPKRTRKKVIQLANANATQFVKLFVRSQ